MGPLRTGLLTSTRRTQLVLLFVLSKRLFEYFFHRFSSGFLDLDFHFTEASSCCQLNLERYCHVHESFLLVYFCFLVTVATSLSFFNPQPLIVGGTLNAHIVGICLV